MSKCRDLRIPRDGLPNSKFRAANSETECSKNRGAYGKVGWGLSGTEKKNLAIRFTQVEILCEKTAPKIPNVAPPHFCAHAFLFRPLRRRARKSMANPRSPYANPPPMAGTLPATARAHITRCSSGLNLLNRRAVAVTMLMLQGAARKTAKGRQQGRNNTRTERSKGGEAHTYLEEEVGALTFRRKSLKLQAHISLVGISGGLGTGASCAWV